MTAIGSIAVSNSVFFLALVDEAKSKLNRSSFWGDWENLTSLRLTFVFVFRFERKSAGWNCSLV